MKSLSAARFALSEHVFRTHFDGSYGFDTQRTKGNTPQELRRAYSFFDGASGEGTRVAIVAALDNVAITENMKMFCNEFSLDIPELSVYYPDGTAENTSREWLVESSLDTQWAHVFAPKAQLLVVFAKNAQVESLISAARYASSELSADIVSMSFGTEETGIDEGLSAFMAGSDSIFVASSGDVGGRVSFPSTSPYCISVGGTKLVLGQNAKRVSETAWQNSGGGMSEVFDIPPWQARFYNIFDMTDGKRATPDISMTANTSPGAAIYVSQLGGWTTAGGSSLSAACFAGICACIKQLHPEIKTSADMLSYLYGKAGTTEYAEPQYSFNDIVFGKSGNFNAKSGWDFTSGLGSPVIRQLVL